MQMKTLVLCLIFNPTLETGDAVAAKPSKSLARRRAAAERTLVASTAARPKSLFLARDSSVRGDDIHDDHDKLRDVVSVDDLDAEGEIYDDLEETHVMPGQHVMTAADYRRMIDAGFGSSPSPAGAGRSSGLPGAPSPAAAGTKLTFNRPPPGVAPPKYTNPKIYPRAFVEMDSTDPHLVEASRSGHASVAALAIASGLGVTAGVPLTRFVMLLPDPARPGVPFAVLRCESSMSEKTKSAFAARYASRDNSSFACAPFTHRMNLTDAGALLLQKQKQRRGRAFEEAAAPRLLLEAGILPATGLDGDIAPADTVASDIVDAAQGSDEPKRVLLDDGNWTYEASGGLKWHALFPQTRAALAGKAFAPFQETSINLGPDPSVVGVRAGPGNVPNATEAQQLDAAESLFKKAETINMRVYNSIQELSKNLARASRAHMQVMTNSSFVPYDPYDMG
mmetsp:Transcript_160106/g.292316  ORF Transcript_160106/g.292316 Transcript_160106/m.292316 type:complete len:451 (-) Transcript_160106:91-1443(-)